MTAFAQLQEARAALTRIRETNDWAMDQCRTPQERLSLIGEGGLMSERRARKEIDRCDILLTAEIAAANDNQRCL